VINGEGIQTTDDDEKSDLEQRDQAVEEALVSRIIKEKKSE